MPQRGLSLEHVISSQNAERDDFPDLSSRGIDSCWSTLALHDIPAQTMGLGGLTHELLGTPVVL